MRHLVVASMLVGCNADTFTGFDAASDAQAEATGEAGHTCGVSFCSTAPASMACADFDNGIPLDWTEVVVQGSLSTTSKQANTCMSLLSEVSSQGDAGALAGARLTKTVNVTPGNNHFVMDLDVYLPTNDTTSFVGYFGLAAGSESAISVTHHADGSWYVSNATFSLNAMIEPPLVGAWNHMTLDILFQSANGSISLTYQKADTTQKVFTVTGGTTTAVLPPSSITVSVGMGSVGVTDADSSALYDNVVVTPK